MAPSPGERGIDAVPVVQSGLEPAVARGWLGSLVGGRYEVIALLGTGGMGTVYRARDTELEEPVALKVLRRDLLDVPGVVERFRREVKLARRVTHRNVARVFDIGEHLGDRFLTMELVEGEPLAERIRRTPLPAEQAIRISLAIAEGLTAAHSAGVVHRDLKPENVLLADDGRVVITDFGIARTRFDEGDALRTVGSAVGTPAYMAPEQIEPDHEIDARADIYAFGAVMFELFTGRRAWPGDSAIAVAAARLLHPPPDPLSVRPELPAPFAEIILRCLARKPADRFPSAEAVAMALRIPSPWLFEVGSGGNFSSYDLRTAPTLINVPASSAQSSSSGAGGSSGSAQVVVSSGERPVASGPSGSGTVVSQPSPSRQPVPEMASLLNATLQSPVPGPRAPAGSPFAALTPGRSARAAGGPSPSAAPVTGVPSSSKTVAVLPFRNAGNPEDEYLADGLTDEIIDTLSMTPGLRVRSRGVVMPHKGTDADPREVGLSLSVGLVVEGSIRRTPSGVRITARVVSVRDGSQLWAKRFDKSTVDVFVVSDEVARAVAEALTLEGSAPAREAPADPVAMDLYLRARQEYRKYWPDNVKESVAVFEQALARAPDNATILSAYALACARLWWFGGTDGGLAGAKAREAAERAHAAAPHLGEPHLALAQVMWNSGDAAGAAREITLAISRAPTLAEAHALRGRILVEAGHIDDGIRSITTAMTLEPGVPLAVGELARAYALMGKWDEIPELSERAGKTEGPQALWFMRARFALWQRDKVTAARFLELMANHPQRVLAVAKWLFEQVLSTTAPTQVIDLSFFVARDEASARRRSFTYQMETEVRMFHAQHEAALASLERSVREGLLDAAWMDRCPLLAPLRGHERFVAARLMVEERVRAVMAEVG